MILCGCGQYDEPKPAEEVQETSAETAPEETTQAEEIQEETAQEETDAEEYVLPAAEYETAENSAEILAAAQEQTEQMRQRFGEDIPAFEPAELVTMIENPDEMTYSGIFEQGIQYGQKSYTYTIRDSHGNDIGEIQQPENEAVFYEANVYDSDGHIIKEYLFYDDTISVTTDTYENGVLRHGMTEDMNLEDGEFKSDVESYYDEHGNMIELYRFFEDGTRKMSDFVENEYDEKGRLICCKYFYSSDNSEPSWTIQYEYDDKGNEVMYDMVYGSSHIVTQREYFSFGSLHRKTILDYDENGELINKTVVEYSYDDPEHVHQILEYEQGKQIYKAIYKYQKIENT